MNKLETTFDKLTKNKNIHECVAYRTQGTQRREHKGTAGCVKKRYVQNSYTLYSISG